MNNIQCSHCKNKIDTGKGAISIWECEYHEIMPSLSVIHDCSCYKPVKIDEVKTNTQWRNLNQKIHTNFKTEEEGMKAQDFLTQSKETMDERGKSWTTQEDGNHYKDMVIQPMQLSMENKLNALQHTIIKYVLRYDKKHKDKTIDLKKAKHCLEMLIEWEEK